MSTEFLFSLAALSTTLLYTCYVRLWKVKPISTSGSLDGNEIEEKDPFEKCNYSNIKVTKLLVHPIKSCRGTSLSEVAYTEEGLKHDRKLAIIDAKTHTVITAREQHNMVLIYPQLIADSSDRDGGRVIISFSDTSGYESFAIPLSPTEETLNEWERIEDIKLWGRKDIDGYICQSVDPEDREAPTRILTRFFGRAVLLVLKGPRPRPCAPTLAFPELKATAVYQDGYPLLVTSEESLCAVKDRLRGEVGKQGVADRWSEDDLVMERFRPNIVLGGAGVPWAEDVWETIRIGKNTSSISLVSKCTRCLLPNVDPETGLRDKAVPYKVLMKFRAGKDPERLRAPCFGCNGVPSGSGMVRVGDSVTVLKFVPR
ncbi:hypothetical protein DFH11DRAFT_1685253 [Phellopilus nigrolimitatus]|nr:hypothetical protein DFH11DRAFT_1685253 [Phellopilus nigrolimitatus]